MFNVEFKIPIFEVMEAYAHVKELFSVSALPLLQKFHIRLPLLLHHPLLSTHLLRQLSTHLVHITYFQALKKTQLLSRMFTFVSPCKRKLAAPLAGIVLGHGGDCGAPLLLLVVSTSMRPRKDVYILTYYIRQSLKVLNPVV